VRPVDRRSRRRPTPRRFLVRRLVAGVVALLLLGGIGTGIAALVGAVGPGHHAAVASPVSSTTTPPPPPPPAEPGGGRRLFPGRRIVAFYGAPDGAALGVLGATSPQAAWPALATQAAPYAQPGVKVLPSFELITYVAQSSPGPDGAYSLRLPDAEIRQYLSVVQAHHGMLILDIQPGRSSFLADARTLAPYLAQPDVGLALDPEWEVGAPDLPGQVIGHTTGAEIDSVGDWLNRFSEARRLPQKLFLIHQFTPGMVVDKAAVAGWYGLATVFNMDGFGEWSEKLGDYGFLASDHRWRLGFKLFYSKDTPLYPPTAVLGLHPTPSVIEYE
jgi:hypothetical protein